MSQGVVSGIAGTLVQAGVLSPEKVAELQAEAQKADTSFLWQVASAKLPGLQNLGQQVAHSFGYPYFDLAAYNKSYGQPDLLDKKFLTGGFLFPLWSRGSMLALAVFDPASTEVHNQIKFATGKSLHLVVVDPDKLHTLISGYLAGKDTSLKSLNVDDVDLGDMEEFAEVSEGSAATDDNVDEAPVVKFLHKVLLEAIQMGASDIHFEPYEKYYRIRYRVDGILKEMQQPPLMIKEKLASRIKVISKLNIAEKRKPQDGRMKLQISKDRAIDFRVSSLPTLFGEKIVMRILDPSSATLGIDALGYEPDQRAALLHAIERPYGMILVTGPTGSGKTVSLYTCLNILNKPDINISTAEDPAEINLPGINQVNVDDRAGLSFSAALKSFLRQDPDIIMVGEIRDMETGEIAIKAAQTGHMVLSTLHTNDAPTTLTRLVNMGIAPFNIASSVILITAQRLCRKLCTCKEPIVLPKEVLLRAGFKEAALDGSWKPYGPKGCERCGGSGYKGRVGIYQVMPISDEMRRIIMENGNALDIAEQARKEGIQDLRQSGLLKVKQGITSLQEIEAVTNE